MKTILFVGDSITDAGRNREDPRNLGQGYPCFIAGRLGLSAPGKYHFLNRGISGDRVVDIYARIKQDILNLKPDVVSILVGINDVWHEMDFRNGINASKFEKIYRMLLEEIREALPNTKIILIEPFVLKGTATATQLTWFIEEVTARANAVRKLAAEFSLPFLPLQADLNELAKQAPEEYWLIDGVHPTVNFHQYIADKWIHSFEKYLEDDVKMNESIERSLNSKKRVQNL